MVLCARRSVRRDGGRRRYRLRTGRLRRRVVARFLRRLRRRLFAGGEVSAAAAAAVRAMLKTS